MDTVDTNFLRNFLASPKTPATLHRAFPAEGPLRALRFGGDSTRLRNVSHDPYGFFTDFLADESRVRFGPDFMIRVGAMNAAMRMAMPGNLRHVYCVARMYDTLAELGVTVGVRLHEGRLSKVYLGVKLT